MDYHTQTPRSFHHSGFQHLIEGINFFPGVLSQHATCIRPQQSKVRTVCVVDQFWSGQVFFAALLSLSPQVEPCPGALPGEGHSCSPSSSATCSPAWIWSAEILIWNVFRQTRTEVIFWVFKQGLTEVRDISEQGYDVYRHTGKSWRKMWGQRKKNQGNKNVQAVSCCRADGGFPPNSVNRQQ